MEKKEETEGGSMTGFVVIRGGVERGRDFAEVVASSRGILFILICTH
jgi:hypothetical protein